MERRRPRHPHPHRRESGVRQAAITQSSRRITKTDLRTRFRGGGPLVNFANLARIMARPEVETDGRGGPTMILPGETEAGCAGT